MKNEKILVAGKDAGCSYFASELKVFIVFGIGEAGRR